MDELTQEYYSAYSILSQNTLDIISYVNNLLLEL